MSTEKQLGCNYQGYEFGASYPDSVCIEGRLFDADHCDSNGNLYDNEEDIPCPMCRREEAHSVQPVHLAGMPLDCFCC